MATVPGYQPGVYSFIPYRYYDDFKEYPLSNALGYLILLVLVYLAFVLKIGPDYMKNRPAYKLKTTLLIYNAIHVVLSVVFVYLTGKPLVLGGFFPRTSIQNEDPEMRKMMFIGCYMYFLGKLTELSDTVFFVLRKKNNQISFLHVYHHSSVVVGTWLMTFYSLNQSAVYGAFINACVHVVMYFYYFAAALGPKYQKYLTWKKYITTFQLVQFVSMFVHQAICLIVTNGEHTIFGVAYITYSSIMFYKLFTDFYKSAYKKPKLEEKEAHTDIKEAAENEIVITKLEVNNKQYGIQNKPGSNPTLFNKQNGIYSLNTKVVDEQNVFSITSDKIKNQ